MSVDDVLARSDVVSLHVPLNGETRQMFGADHFGRMRPGALLINTSRGEIVDETALLNALEDGPLGGAALDVVDDETGWHVDRPLARFAASDTRLIITPHIAGCAREAMEATEDFVAGRLLEALRS